MKCPECGHVGSGMYEAGSLAERCRKCGTPAPERPVHRGGKGRKPDPPAPLPLAPPLPEDNAKNRQAAADLAEMLDDAAALSVAAGDDVEDFLRWARSAFEGQQLESWDG